MESCPRGVFGLRSRGGELPLKPDYCATSMGSTPSGGGLGSDAPDYYMFGQPSDAMDTGDGKRAN